MRNSQTSQCDALPSHCADKCGNVQKSDLIRDREEKDTEKDIETDNIPGAVQRDFERFWSAYPKKVGKKTARKAFSQAKMPVETLLTAVERQKRSVQWSKENGQYIPNPATWLTQGRWEDELETVPEQHRDGPVYVPDGKGSGVWILPQEERAR